MKRAICLGLLPATGMVLSVPGCYDPRRQKRAPSPRPSLTGGLRLELLTDVCPIGLTHAGRPEVGVGSQNGRQVDGCSWLLGRRVPLAGCWVALQGQRGSSWEQKGQVTAPVCLCFQRKMVFAN